MKQLIKFFLPILCIALLLTALTSCKKNEETDILINAQSLSRKVKTTETTTKTMNFFPSNFSEEELNALKQSHGEGTTVTVSYFDGDNCQITNKDGVTTIFDNVMYFDMGDLKYKAPYSVDDETDDALAFRDGLDTFESYEITENADGSVTIRAKGNKVAGYVTDLLNDPSNFKEGMSMNVGMQVEYVIEIDSVGRFSSIYAKVIGVVSMAGSIYVMGTTETTEVFDYSDVMDVTAPADADAYEDMDMSSLF